MVDINIDGYFSRIVNILQDVYYTNREKLFLLFDIIKDYYRVLAEQEKSSFTDFAIFNYVFVKYEVPDELKTRIYSFRRLVSKLRNNKVFFPNNKLIHFYSQSTAELLSFLSKCDISVELRDILLFNSVNDTKNTDYSSNLADDEAVNTNESQLYNLRLTFINKQLSDNTTEFFCNDEMGNRVIIAISSQKFFMCNMVWKQCSMLLTMLKPLSEQSVLKESQYYETTSKTQIILEPDYLIDVTDIVECFSNKAEFPIIPILKKFLNRPAGITAFKGNITNSFFDELLENIEIDFETALHNALVKKPLAIPVTIKQLQELGNNVINFADLVLYFRRELYDVFDNLRHIITNNYLNKDTITEPSFISNLYGIQGRLDLLIQQHNDENSITHIDIIELKSNKPPTKNITANFGFGDEKRSLRIPLWKSHYIQIVCYNMLTDHLCSSGSAIQKGFSSILYSIPKELHPIRNVVDNLFVQNEILAMRNWFIAFMRELALGNMTMIENINTEQIFILPPYIQEDANALITKIGQLSDLEKSYFQAQISFITKEIFASKIGLFSDSFHSNNNVSFASLWRLSLEEKILYGRVITGLFLNKEDSDFIEMHISFDICATNSIHPNYISTTFRKGDICIVYPNLSSNQHRSDSNNLTYNYDPTSTQLLRGRIMQIGDGHILVSFRNKLSYKLLEYECEWLLEYDYIELMNNYLYSSISDFIFSDCYNKYHILGLSEPLFEAASVSLEYADTQICDLSLEKQEIIKTALLSKNYFLIQGPPGTGKTSYILRYLAQLLFCQAKENILILAYTNRAVDEICNSLDNITLVDNDFDYIRLGGKDSTERAEKILSSIPIESINEKISNCKCFVSTISTANASYELFQMKHFDTIIIDEAAQILECNIVGLLAKSRRFIMIGDEKQLPAVSTISNKFLAIQDETLNSIELKCLGDSLFERLLRICKKNNWGGYAMLSEQSRMNSDIMNIVNNLFYNGHLRSNAIIEHLVISSLLPHSSLFIDTPTEPYSKMNLTEIDIIIRLIEHYKSIFGGILGEKQIGIISPWRIQCNAIINRLSSEDRKLITVDTVERFQGSEREIIIFSAATNNSNLLNLLSSTRLIDRCLIDRKLNVAITRAKQQFILLGNSDLLSKKEVYQKLITQLVKIEPSMLS